MNSIKELLVQIMNLIMKFGIRSGIKLIVPIIAKIGSWIKTYFNKDERNEFKQEISNGLQSVKEKLKK
ncbi:hypothetical protein Brsp06_03470 [Brucella sp. NBRC 13694]|uniref:hypothetical protein n=1 Tax=Brucella sp. NBRC 13694 TaxID=3075482 RepID=UPI0030A99D73